MRILLADDEIPFTRSLQSVLRSEGYAVDVVHDGQTAYDRAFDDVYDLLLLDVGMPGMNGVELCRRLREDGLAVPVLMLTARDATSDRIRGLDSGADDYIVKPFEVDELLARIRSALRRLPKAELPLLAAGTLTMDVAARTVRRSGQDIELSAKEFALLEFLLRHKGMVISKQQLIDHVWDESLDPFSNIVDVYIGYLRNKIDRPFAEEPLLKTVRGAGYRIG
jgi:DNA-binding response OmpR family regulator